MTSTVTGAVDDEYHKIDSMFMRGKGKKLQVEELTWTKPEFEYLANHRWFFTEKVDGTNIRLGYEPGSFRGNEVAYVNGRTNDAGMDLKLVRALVKLQQGNDFEKQFPDLASGSYVVLHGEGYGPGVQSGGEYSRDEFKFVLFDVTVDGWTLSWENVVNVAQGLQLDVVPVVGEGSLFDGIDLVREGFASQWPGVKKAEGIVARPMVDLWDKKGERIITKIKTRDFGS